MVKYRYLLHTLRILIRPSFWLPLIQACLSVKKRHALTHTHFSVDFSFVLLYFEEPAIAVHSLRFPAFAEEPAIAVHSLRFPAFAEVSRLLAS